MEKGDWERVQKELLPSGKVLPAAIGALIDIFWSNGIIDLSTLKRSDSDNILLYTVDAVLNLNYP